MPTKTKTLKSKTLLSKFEKNKNYGGFGLIGHECRNTTTVDQVYDHVVKDLGLTDKEAFEYANSKIARFVGDEIKERKLNPVAIKKTLVGSIKKYLPSILAEVS